MFDIYRIHVYGEGSNAYTTARSERWQVKLDCTFDNEQDAKNYVISQSRQHTDLPLHLQSWRESKDSSRTEEEVIESYLFNNPLYAKHRRFFINYKPTLKDIQSWLKEEGIQVIKQSINLI